MPKKPPAVTGKKAVDKAAAKKSAATGRNPKEKKLDTPKETVGVTNDAAALQQRELADVMANKAKRDLDADVIEAQAEKKKELERTEGAKVFASPPGLREAKSYQAGSCKGCGGEVTGTPVVSGPGRPDSYKCAGCDKTATDLAEIVA